MPSSATIPFSRTFTQLVASRFPTQIQAHALKWANNRAEANSFTREWVLSIFFLIAFFMQYSRSSLNGTKSSEKWAILPNLVKFTYWFSCIVSIAGKVENASIQNQNQRYHNAVCLNVILLLVPLFSASKNDIKISTVQAISTTHSIKCSDSPISL